MRVVNLKRMVDRPVANSFVIFASVYIEDHVFAHSNKKKLKKLKKSRKTQKTKNKNIDRGPKTHPKSRNTKKNTAFTRTFSKSSCELLAPSL